MGKIKRRKEIKDEHPHEILRQNLNRISNKIITRDGKVKKKNLKQYTAYQCDVCNKKFEDKWNLASHRKLHLGEAYSCDLCPYVGATKKYLARHKRWRHSAPRHECAVCGLKFHHPCGLREHNMVHTGEKPLECTVCGKRFRVSYSLNSHMLIHKNEKPYKCSFCEYACRDSSTLRKHEHRHMGIVRMFPCKICRKKFDSKPKLKCHIAEVHLEHLEVDVRRLECDRCGKTFKKRQHLNVHIQVTHESVPCTCPLCGKRLKHERYLAQHMRTHFPERPHACTHPGCGKAFKDKSVLYKHVKIHQPHLHAACAQCGATFSRPQRLRSHMRTHEPRTRSVTCDYCRVTFYSKNYLIQHIKQKHSEDGARFECDHCGLVARNKPGIVMHLKYGHCREQDALFCKICKTRYKKMEYLRSHYLKTHKMVYRPRRRKKKPITKTTVEVKVEPVEEDPPEEVDLSMLEVTKEELELDEEGAESLENDLISYSKHVLSEDLQTYLLTEPNQDRPDSSFDQFLLKHVFPQIKDEEPEPKIEKTDKEQEAIVTKKIKEAIKKAKEDKAKKILEKKKKRQEKLLEKKLKKEAKILRRKKRRERFELERVRLMYNERMKRAAAEALKKEPAKKIKYFQQKTSEETNTEKESKNTSVSNSNENNDLNESVNDHNLNKDQGPNENVYIDGNENENTTHTDTIAKISATTNSTINSLDKNQDETENSTLCVSDSNINETKNGTFSVNYENLNASKKDDMASDKCIVTNIEQSCTKNETESANDAKNCINNAVNDDSNISMECANDKYKITDVNQNCTSNNNTNDEQNSSNDKCNDTNDKGSVNIHEIIRLNEKNTRSKNKGNDNNESVINKNNDDETEAGDSNNDNSDDSDYEPNFEDEPAPSKKIKFQTHQCYICFKLYKTKEELISHCESHFDVCNSTLLSKCPVCGHVVSRGIAHHMRDNHDVHLNIAYTKISTRDDGQGSKYCYKSADTVLEIIPSVKMLNHTASIQIDKKKREMRDKTVARTRLVKKGTEWIVEKYAANLNYQEMPSFTEQELEKLPVSSGYVERLAQLSKLARARGFPMLYPCDACDKICQSLAALRLHGRRHDPHKKPFAARGGGARAREPLDAADARKAKIMKHRTAKPQPIKNKHKCDLKLKQFYETHIRGADIEFWQFLKIYNKMEREQVNEFSDLEQRTDFGIHNYRDDSGPGNESADAVHRADTDVEAQRAEPSNAARVKSKRKLTGDAERTKISAKKRKLSSQSAQQGGSKRVIMISKRQHLEREKMKSLLREQVKGNKRD